MNFKEIIEEESKKEYFKELQSFVDEEYKNKTVFPERKNIYASLENTPFDKVKVVIIGQDPYHGEGEAHGFAFSVKPGIKIPPSLKNIYKELNTEYGCYIPNNGYLMKWAEQGVLLLNAVLTVRAHQAASHQRKGWEEFTDACIKVLADQDRPLVFILWGTPARRKKALIHNPKHLIVESPHPSPLSAHNGFFGSKPFSRTNAYLESVGLEPIDWQIR